MAQLRLINPCDRLEDIIHDINNRLDSLHESESALLLMDSAMVKLLLDSIKEIKIIEAQPGLLDTRLGYALRIYKLKNEYSKVRSRFYRTIKKIVEQYNRSSYISSLFSKEDVDYITTTLFDSNDSLTVSMKDELRLINLNSSRILKKMSDGLSQILYFYDGILLVGERILDKLKPEYTEMRELTVRTIRDYCKTFYTQKLLTNLRHEAVRLMGGEKYTRVTPENWIDLLTNEDKLIELGKSRLVLKECQDSKAEDARFEFYGEDRCKILDDSQDLMDIILRVNYGLELFDLEGALDNYNLLSALNENNLDLFCEMFLRRNVMLGMIEPELKKDFEKWLTEQEKVDDDAAPLSRDRQTIFDSIMKYINKGDWKAPATMENVKDFMHVVLGREPSRLDANDRQMPEKLWKLLTSGRTTCKKDGNTRLEITWAKICGLFYSYHFFYGEPHHILNKIFGEQKYLSSHFSKGKNPDDKGYREILPFLEKYIEKIIKT